MGKDYIIHARFRLTNLTLTFQNSKSCPLLDNYSRTTTSAVHPIETASEWGRILNFGIGQVWSLVGISTALNTFIWCDL